MSLRAGFVGLGRIGRPMALRVAARADSLAVFDVRLDAMEPLVSAGARACASCAEVAQHADVIGVAVLDDAQVDAAIGGADGLLAGAAPGSVICVSSTVRLATIFALAEAAAHKDVAVLDAGVAGGWPSAGSGTLVTMVGGAADALERARPMLDAFSKEVIHAGALGAGMRLKLVKNHVSYLALAAAHEGRLLAEAAGIDNETLRHVIRETNVIEQFFDWALERPGFQRLALDAEADALDHARAFSAVARKDLASAVELGESLGIELPFAAEAVAQAGRFFLLPRSEDDSGAT